MGSNQRETPLKSYLQKSLKFWPELNDTLSEICFKITPGGGGEGRRREELWLAQGDRQDRCWYLLKLGDKDMDLYYSTSLLCVHECLHSVIGGDKINTCSRIIFLEILSKEFLCLVIPSRWSPQLPFHQIYTLNHKLCDKEHSPKDMRSGLEKGLWQENRATQILGWGLAACPLESAFRLGMELDRATKNDRKLRPSENEGAEGERIQQEGVGLRQPWRELHPPGVVSQAVGPQAWNGTLLPLGPRPRYRAFWTVHLSHPRQNSSERRREGEWGCERECKTLSIELQLNRKIDFFPPP